MHGLFRSPAFAVAAWFWSAGAGFAQSDLPAALEPPSMPPAMFKDLGTVYVPDLGPGLGGTVGALPGNFRIPPLSRPDLVPPDFPRSENHGASGQPDCPACRAAITGLKVGGEHVGVYNGYSAELRFLLRSEGKDLLIVLQPNEIRTLHFPGASEIAAFISVAGTGRVDVALLSRGILYTLVSQRDRFSFVSVGTGETAPMPQ